ncbi:MAG: competence/damage-inducible protein A, partial [Bacteroidota bacterium]
EIITIGDELLIGQIADTNARFMASLLSDNGFDIYRITSVGDLEEDIVLSLGEANRRSKFVFISGGLGPTNDDVTRNAITQYFKCHWEEDQRMLKRIREFLAKRGYSMTGMNREQARIPQGAGLFINRIGTAPGIWLTRGDTHFIFLPGVPFEMKQLMEESVIPHLKKAFIKNIYKRKHIITQGIPESYLAEKLKVWEQSLPASLKLAYLPSPGMINLRLSGQGDSPEALEELLNEQIEKLKPILSEYLVHVGEESLEEILGRLLIEHGQTISTAESCTGGAISSRITSVPGSSGYYKGSVVAYSNEQKIKLLGVQEKTLEAYGAVSKEVVENMAEGALDLLQSDYSVAVSGIAGPSGGTEEKPVGLVWIAVASSEKTVSHKFLFGNKRDMNIQKATNTALNMARKMVLHEY